MATTLSKIHENISEALLSAQAAAYTPTTAYTGGLPSKTVKKGSKGTDVKHVQNFLNWCIKAGLKVDGYCGSKTTAAIKKYQKQYKLKVDGIFGSATQRAVRVQRRFTLCWRTLPLRTAPSASLTARTSQLPVWSRPVRPAPPKIIR